jgi:hypothetical protein
MRQLTFRLQLLENRYSIPLSDGVCDKERHSESSVDSFMFEGSAPKAREEMATNVVTTNVTMRCARCEFERAVDIENPAVEFAIFLKTVRAFVGRFRRGGLTVRIDI